MSTSALPREIVRWLQTLDLSFPVKQPKRDLANGYCIAEICSRYWPDVPMHSFSNQLSAKNRESNWFMVRKVFCSNGFVLQTVSPYPNPSPSMKLALRKGMSHEEVEFDDLLVGTMNAQEGSALTLLELLYTGLTKRKIQTAAPLEADNTLEKPPPFIKTNAVEDGYVRQSGTMLSQKEIQEKEENSRKSADERKKIEEAKKAEELAKFKSGMAGQNTGGRIAASLVKKQVESIRQAPKDGDKDPGVQFSEVTVKALPANLLARYGGGGGSNGDGDRNGAASNGRSSASNNNKNSNSNNNNGSGAAGFRQDSQTLLGYLSNECLGRIFAEELQQDIPATWSFTSDAPCLFTYLIKHTDITSPLMDTLWERLAARIPSIATVVMSTPTYLGDLLECFLVVNGSSTNGFQYPIVPLRKKTLDATTNASGNNNNDLGGSGSNGVGSAVPILTSCADITDALRHSLKKKAVETTRQNLRIRFSAQMPHHAFLSTLLAMMNKQAPFRLLEVLRQFAAPYLVERLNATHGIRWPYEVTLGYAWTLTQLLQPTISAGPTRLEMPEAAATQLLRVFSCLLDGFGGNSKDPRYIHLVELVTRSTVSHGALLHNSNASIAAVPPTASSSSPNNTHQGGGNTSSRGAATPSAIGGGGNSSSSPMSTTASPAGPQLPLTFAHPTLSTMMRHSVTNILSYAPKGDCVLRGLGLLEVWAATLPPSLWEETFSLPSSYDGGDANSSSSSPLSYLNGALSAVIMGCTGRSPRSQTTSPVALPFGRIQGEQQWIACIQLVVSLLKAPWFVSSADQSPPASWPTIVGTTETHPLEVLRELVMEAVDGLLGGVPSGGTTPPFLTYPLGRGSAPPSARLFVAHALSQVLHNVYALLVAVYDADAADVQVATYTDVLFAYLVEVDSARAELGLITSTTRPLADPQSGPPATTTELPTPTTLLLPSTPNCPPIYVYGANQGPVSSTAFLLEAVARASKVLQTSSALDIGSRVLSGGARKQAHSSASSASGASLPAGSAANTGSGNQQQQPTHHNIVKDGQVPAATTFLLSWAGRLLAGMDRTKQGTSPLYRHLLAPQEDASLVHISCGLSSDSITRWWRFIKEDLSPHALVILHAATLLHQRRSAQAPVDPRADSIITELMVSVKQSVLWTYIELSGLKRAIPAAWAPDNAALPSMLPLKAGIAATTTTNSSTSATTNTKESPEQLAAREQAAITWFSSHVTA